MIIYSSTERALIGTINPDALKMVDAHPIVDKIYPSRFYNNLAVYCFMTRRQEDKASESLRRVLEAMDSADVYRNTPEFDALIQL